MKTVQSVLVILCATSFVIAQPREGARTELGLSASYQNYSSGSSSGKGALLLSPRVGFYVIEGLEIEPELLWMVAEGVEPTYMLNGNLSYNFKTEGKAWPFILAGYGTANTVPFFNVPMFRSGFSVGVLNLGAGLKYYVKEDVAIRMEYRYQKFSGEQTESYYGFSYTSKIDMKLNTVQFGLSVLL